MNLCPLICEYVEQRKWSSEKRKCLVYFGRQDGRTDAWSGEGKKKEKEGRNVCFVNIFQRGGKHTCLILACQKLNNRETKVDKRQRRQKHSPEKWWIRKRKEKKKYQMGEKKPKTERSPFFVNSRVSSFFLCFLSLSLPRFLSKSLALFDMAPRYIYWSLHSSPSSENTWRGKSSKMWQPFLFFLSWKKGDGQSFQWSLTIYTQSSSTYHLLFHDFLSH